MECSRGLGEVGYGGRELKETGEMRGGVGKEENAGKEIRGCSLMP